jgi:hypothetical protein
LAFCRTAALEQRTGQRTRHRLKFIKRSIYGRASFYLTRHSRNQTGQLIIISRWTLNF